MEQNNDNKKELLKTGAKLALKSATAPFRAAIMGAIGAILPYVLGGMLIFVVVLCVYFGTLEQINQIFDETAEMSLELGERVGNAVSLYGFRTNEEVNETEEYKYFFMLDLYKSLFNFNNYEISLLSQTLLYEGSNEERIYLSETVDGANSSNGTFDINNSNGKISISSDGTSDIFWNFFKNIATNYQRGFLTSYGGQSQYLKANKNMLVNAAALKKCKNLTGGDLDKEKQCYKGYLVADYNLLVDYLIDCSASDPVFGSYCVDNKLESEVEVGYLVLPNNLIGAGVGNINEFMDIRNNILTWLSGYTIVGGLTKNFLDFEENMRDTLTIFILGSLADEDSKHFFYDGYVVQNLKEKYKVRKNEKFDYSNEFVEIFEVFDKEIYLKERVNKEKTADSILNLVETYYELIDKDINPINGSYSLPPQGFDETAYGTSCSPIPSADLPYFSSPTTSCSVTSCFGVYAGSWTCKSHKGIDVNAAGGIFSVCDGVVTRTGMYNDGSASTIEVECNINGKTYKVRYLHMPLSDVNKWSVGDSVPKGTYLGQQGAVGNGVTGAHLHLDISVNGSYVNPEVLVSNCSFYHNCESSRNYCESTGQYYCK